MKRIAILGLGLMGGSLGLALKRRKSAYGKVCGYARRPETRKLALKLNAIDEVFDNPAKAVEDADVVVLCVPILAIPDLVAKCKGSLKRGCLVTDVGSTKAQLAERIEPLLKRTGAVFVGSHPLAGSEQQGLEAARANLYEQAVVVVTPPDGKAGPAVESLKKFWENLGATVKVMTPDEHDRVVARTSHLPHIAAALVSATVGRDGDPRQIGTYCGPGFRDTTRIAEGSPEVWHDIIQSNRECLAGELAEFKFALERVSSMVEKGNFDQLLKFLKNGRSKRKQLMQGKRGDDQRGDL
jgi:prephenate dehydrogenase